MRISFITCTFLLIIPVFVLNAQDSWKEAQLQGKARIDVYHVTAPPFIYQENQQARGIETELFLEFKKFVRENYSIQLDIQFIQMEEFQEMYTLVKTSGSGVFGASSLSITEERMKEINFSPPYMPDIQALVSSSNVPIVNSIEEFKEVFQDLEGITLSNTTAEYHLLNLRRYIPNFPIRRVQKYKEIYKIVATEEDKFAYVQLDSYFMALDQGLSLARQNMFKIDELGRAFVYAKKSDWREPIEAFFNQPTFKQTANAIIQNYFGEGVNDLIWEVADSSTSDRNKDVIMLTKEKEMQTLELAKRALNAQQQAIFRNYLIGGMVVIVIFTFLLYNRYQIKQKSNSLLLHKNEEITAQRNELVSKNEELHQQREEILAQRDFIEKKNKELDQRNSQIFNSIKAALVIQKAMLPYESRMQEILHEHFVIYHAKDIVSGDFYWTQTLRDSVFLAVADCTGHGVPGALMAMLGQALLDKIVLTEEDHNPATILLRLHEEIQYALKQKDVRNNYGMDICLISYQAHEEEGYTLNFAGAKRPLYFSRPDSTAIQVIRGDRKSIGGWQNDIDAFRCEQVFLPKGSLVYLSTDGLVDQNNFARKKFSEKRLKNLLFSNKDQALQVQQEAIEAALERHKQGTAQRDDILLIGFKV